MEGDRLRRLGYAGDAVDTSAVKEVVFTDMNAATVIIGIAMLVIAFATLVLKIIEIARSK